jgi:polyhydroxybutyrate depolymerase
LGDRRDGKNGLVGLVVAAAMLASAARSEAYDTIAIDLGRGPVNVHVPVGYRAETPVALVMLLHGYTSSGAGHEAYLGFLPLVDELSFIYLYPDGTTNPAGARFWNATEACCDFYRSGVDDSGYLRSLIDTIRSRYTIDPARVFLVGHSNGGFMSYRMACEHAEVVTGVASLAGATYVDPGQCRPTRPVHVLQIHGTVDEAIGYDGGCIFSVGCYPGALQTVGIWAGYDGCQPLLDATLPPIDLEATLIGAETTIDRYPVGCLAGGSVTLWSIVGGRHSPAFHPTLSRFVLEHLFALTAAQPQP